MTKELTTAEIQELAVRRDNESKTTLGFWLYLMTDCVLFASLFATFMVLRGNTFGGPGEHELYNMPNVLAETLILLTSSFVCGLATIAVQRRAKNAAIALFTVTALLGLAFLTLELTEFHHLAIEGNSWRRSGFLSAFFTLVGTHGLHITIGLLWMVSLLVQVFRKGLTEFNSRRLLLLSMFWHFLDVIWIFIFSIVYLIGTTR